MVALFLLLVIGVFVAFFLLSFLYKAIGKFVYRIGKDTIDIILEEEKGEND